MTPEVKNAVEEIKLSFRGAQVTAESDGQGGAFVCVDPISLTEGKYTKSKTWIGFQVTFQYPHSDIYPHFVDPDLRLANVQQQPGGPPLGEASSMGTYREQPAIQISRRSPRRDPILETAAIKLLKVQKWLNR